MFIDLHVHTHHSDGSFSPAQVVEYARRINLKAIAIADHDTIEGLREGKIVARKMGVEFIDAVELTTSFDESEIHILGYFIDKENCKLKERLSKAKEWRVERMKEIIQKLKKLGMDISYEEIGRGRPCVERAQIIQEMLKKGYITAYEEGFKKYLGFGCPAYVEPYRFTPEEAIAIIREAGGVAVLAHPGGFDVSGKRISEEDVRQFVQHGLEGLEVYSYFHDEGKTNFFTSIAKKMNLLITGGSDCHGPLFGIQMGRQKIEYNLLGELKNYLLEQRRRYAT